MTLAVVADWKRGLPWPTIAKRNDVSEQQAREAYASWRESENGAIAGLEPLEIVKDLLESYATIEGRLAVIAETAPNPSERVRAFRAQMDAMARRTELMQASGLLPRRLGQLRVEHDARVTAARIARIFEQHGVSEEARQAVIDAIESGS